MSWSGEVNRGSHLCRVATTWCARLPMGLENCLQVSKKRLKAVDESLGDGRGQTGRGMIIARKGEDSLAQELMLDDVGCVILVQSTVELGSFY